MSTALIIIIAVVAWIILSFVVGIIVGTIMDRMGK